MNRPKPAAILFAALLLLVLLMSALSVVRIVHEVDPPETPVYVYYCDCDSDCKVRP